MTALHIAAAGVIAWLALAAAVCWGLCRLAGRYDDRPREQRVTNEAETQVRLYPHYGRGVVGTVERPDPAVVAWMHTGMGADDAVLRVYEERRSS